MSEVLIKVDISPELKPEFEVALAKVVKKFINSLELSIAKELVSKSKFTEKDADELAIKVKSSMHKE